MLTIFLWTPVCNRVGKSHLPLLDAPGVRQRMLTFFLWTPVCIKKDALPDTERLCSHNDYVISLHEFCRLSMICRNILERTVIAYLFVFYTAFITFKIYSSYLLKETRDSAYTSQLHSDQKLAPNSVALACNDFFIWHKSPTNCDAHLTETIFQIRSKKLH